MTELHPSQHLLDQKTQFEINKLALEMELLTLDKAKKLQDIRRATSDADLAEQEYKLAVSSDHYGHEFTFNDRVDEISVGQCRLQLDVWHRQDPYCDMHIIMNSPGGYVANGMELFDRINAYSLRGDGTHNVTMTIRGIAASMGGILVQAADNRVMGKQAVLMIHEIAAGTQGKIGDLKDDIKFYEASCERVIDIFVERSGKISREEFKAKWERKDWFLHAEEAIRLGFVDKIG